MKYSDDLRKIVEDKKFKNFWKCYEYLLVAGYKPLDAFGICLEQFGEEKIWSDVAWIRVSPQVVVNSNFGNINGDGEYNTFDNCDHLYINQPNGITTKGSWNYTIGLIDETNRHLNGLYDLYRKNLLGIGKLLFQNNPELERTTEQIEFKTIPLFLDEYLECTFLNHFGYGFDVYKDKVKAIEVQTVARQREQLKRFR